MWIVIASAATLATASAVAAHTTTTHTTHVRTASTGAPSAADRGFMLNAARGGLAEVELGRLAAGRASNGDVRSFGQMMVDDHSAVNAQLQTLASSKGITLPTTMASDKRSLHKRLQGLSGAAFDRAYMQAMVRDHRRDVAAFRKESTSGHDADVTQFATQTLPKLQQHLHEAERIWGQALPAASRSR